MLLCAGSFGSEVDTSLRIFVETLADFGAGASRIEIKTIFDRLLGRFRVGEGVG